MVSVTARLLSYLRESSSELQNYRPRVPLVRFAGRERYQVDKNKTQIGKLGLPSLEYSWNCVLRLNCAFYQALMLLVYWYCEHETKRTVSTWIEYAIKTWCRMSAILTWVCLHSRTEFWRSRSRDWFQYASPCPGSYTSPPVERKSTSAQPILHSR